MEKPKFKNKPNWQFHCGGITHWVHRAPSVDGFIFALAPKEINWGELHVLVIRRSDNMEVDPGKYGVPCGHLDWDETLYDAMVREVYEETSLYLPDYRNYLEFDNNRQPFLTDSNPRASYNSRQNVGHHFVIALDFSEKSVDEFPLFVENYTSSETSLVKWMPMYDFNINDLEWSFNHHQGIIDAQAFFMQGFSNPDWFYKNRK